MSNQTARLFGEANASSLKCASILCSSSLFLSSRSIRRLSRLKGSTILEANTNGECSSFQTRLKQKFVGKRRQLAVSRLLDPGEFQSSKLRVDFVGGALQSDFLDMSKSIPRVYTLTHCDLTADLHLAIGPRPNHKQLHGWYQRLLRDEVIARWRVNCMASSVSLHVHCHLSGAHSFMAPAALRNWIFTRELPLVLEAIRYGDGALLSRQPELWVAPVWVHFDSADAQLARAELWGPLHCAGAGGTTRSRRQVQLLLSAPQEGRLGGGCGGEEGEAEEDNRVLRRQQHLNHTQRLFEHQHHYWRDGSGANNAAGGDDVNTGDDLVDAWTETQSRSQRITLENGEMGGELLKRPSRRSSQADCMDTCKESLQLRSSFELRANEGSAKHSGKGFGYISRDELGVEEKAGVSL